MGPNLFIRSFLPPLFSVSRLNFRMSHVCFEVNRRHQPIFNGKRNDTHTYTNTGYPSVQQGAIHKRRRPIFSILWPPPSPFVVFLLSKFRYFRSPLPLPALWGDVIYGWPPRRRVEYQQSELSWNRKSDSFSSNVRTEFIIRIRKTKWTKQLFKHRYFHHRYFLKCQFLILVLGFHKKLLDELFQIFLMRFPKAHGFVKGVNWRKILGYILGRWGCNCSSTVTFTIDIF